MLSIENETLRGENDELKVKSTKNAAADDSKIPGKHGGRNNVYNIDVNFETIFFYSTYNSI